MVRPGLAPPGSRAEKARQNRLNSRWLRWFHRNSFTFLFLVLLVLFILQGWLVTPTFLIQGSVIALLLCATMAIQAFRYSDWPLGLTCLISSGVVLCLWGGWALLPLLPNAWQYGALGLGLSLLATVLACMIGSMVFHLWHNDYTGRNALFCAASSYLLIGFLWSCFFALISYFVPGSFADNVLGITLNMQGTEVHDNFHRFYYFSMITITTVGYGDMIPVAPLARSLAWMEAAIGQFYFALILTRLVASQFVTTVEKIASPPTPPPNSPIPPEAPIPPGSGILETINPGPTYPEGEETRLLRRRDKPEA